MKFVPFLKDPIEAAQDLAESRRAHAQFTAEPLAYLAFARAELLPAQRYRNAHERGLPLLEAIAADSLEA